VARARGDNGVYQGGLAVLARPPPFDALLLYNVLLVKVSEPALLMAPPNEVASCEAKVLFVIRRKPRPGEL
jgi:hypothetical protein